MKQIELGDCFKTPLEFETRGLLIKQGTLCVVVSHASLDTISSFMCMIPDGRLFVCSWAHIRPINVSK